MRKIAAGCLVALACLAQAQFNYDVFVGGKKVGTAVVEEKLTPHGKSETMRLVVEQAGQSIGLTNTALFDSNGLQLREAMSLAASGMSRTVTVAFKGPKALVTASQSGSKPTTSTVSAQAGAKLSDPSEFWFMKSRPKVGAVVRSTKFDIESLTWEDTVSTYVGDSKVTVHGKSVSGHQVTTKHGSSTGTVFLDDQGHILLYRENTMTLERTN